MRNEYRALESRPNLDPSYRKAQETLATDAIDPESFADLYGVDQVAADLAYVAKLEAKDREAPEEEQERKKMATILEAIVLEQAELSEWFGPEAHTIKPSTYDDFVNGVDGIVEFQEDERRASHLALAMDVTYAQGLDKKLDRIRREIEQGTLTQIKYFESEHLGIRGEKSRVPRVVIGVDWNPALDLTGMWLRGDKKALGTHPVQFQILREMLMQLETFERYARKVNQSGVAEEYHSAAEIVREVLEVKGGGPDEAEFGNDRVYAALKDSLADFGTASENPAA